MLRPFDLMKKSTFSSLASLFAPLVLAGFVTAVAYQLFYLFAPFIWSLNTTCPLGDYTPAKRLYIMEPRNGMQLYVLYGLVYLIIAITFLLYRLISTISVPSLRRSFLIFSALPCLLFFRTVGFTPPMAEYSRSLFHDSPAMYFMLSVLGITILLTQLLKNRCVLSIILGLFLFPACMVASAHYSGEDYDYILFPAMRILHGFPLNQTGFQYDHLLSLLAVLWMKLGFSIYSFSIVGQISVYAFFMGLYLFVSRFFTHKCYALYLLISAVLVRMYGNIADIIVCFQVTPLRLDWWFVVLLSVYFKGDAHWLTGLVLGLLLIFHHAFGVIYTLAYALLVLFFYCMDVLSKKDPLSTVSRNYVMLYAKNFVLLGASFLIYQLFFAFGQSTASLYRQHGIGFLPVLRQSFYWYVPVMLSVFFIYHWRNRSFLSARHFRAVVFLILLAIGNSLYFFGRSHENNIINISSILLLCFFLLFDLVHSEFERSFSWKPARWILPLLAVVFIGAISFVYAGKAPERLREQAANFMAHEMCGRDHGVEQLLRSNTTLIKELTRFNPKVTFVSGLEAYYYHESGYVPQSPSGIPAMLFMKDMVGFLDTQLLEGYYLAMPRHDALTYGEVMVRPRARNGVPYPFVLIISNNEIG